MLLFLIMMVPRALFTSRMLSLAGFKLFVSATPGWF